jgi:hypothetical protein
MRYFKGIHFGDFFYESGIWANVPIEELLDETYAQLIALGWKGIKHGDLHLYTIMVGEEAASRGRAQVQLIDFGNAEQLGDIDEAVNDNVASLSEELARMVLGYVYDEKNRHVSPPMERRREIQEYLWKHYPSHFWRQKRLIEEAFVLQKLDGVWQLTKKRH